MTGAKVSVFKLCRLGVRECETVLKCRWVKRFLGKKARQVV